MKCSNLNNHLVIRHISENPNCQCNEDIEDVKHFLLDCKLHTSSRDKYIPSNTSLENLLYGNPNLNTRTNMEIFESVALFIEDTKRF